MDKKGSTLVGIIFLVMIMSVFALTLFTISLTDSKLVVQQDDNIQSYYVARSAVDAVAYELIHFPGYIADIDAEDLADQTSSGTIANGDFEVTVTWDQPNDIVTIIGESEVEKQKSRVTLTLTRITMDHAIWSENSLDVHRMRHVDGDLGSNGTIRDYDNQGDPIDGREGDTNDEYMDLTIPTPEIPNFGTREGDINGDYESSFGAVYTLSEANYRNFEVNSSENITFDTTLNDIEIVVEEYMQLKGDVFITGGGTVTFYILVEGDLQTPSEPLYHEDQLLFYLDEGAYFTIDTPRGVNARIVGPTATVDMSGNAELTGSIIAQTFVGWSNSEVRYTVPSDGEIVLGYRILEWK